MAHQDEFGRQERLFSIIHAYFGSDNDRVVEAILETTGQKVTVRSVQAWLIAPNKVSHRRVPDWALKGLEDYIQQPGRVQELKEFTARQQERRMNSAQKGNDWVHEIISQKAVEFATREIELDAQKQQQWTDTFGKQCGMKLFEHFNSLENKLLSISTAFGSLLHAIDQSEDIEQLRRRIEQSITSDTQAKHFVRQAREDIERGVKEFSNDEGLPTSKAKN